jgi:hypothetical protein
MAETATSWRDGAQKRRLYPAVMGTGIGRERFYKILYNCIFKVYEKI